MSGFLTRACGLYTEISFTHGLLLTRTPEQAPGREMANLCAFIALQEKKVLFWQTLHKTKLHFQGAFPCCPLPETTEDFTQADKHSTYREVCVATTHHCRDTKKQL